MLITRECPFCWKTVVGTKERIDLHVDKCEEIARERADDIFVETDRLFHVYHMNRTEQEMPLWGGMSSQ